MLVRERADTIGGAARSLELTLPGFVHDHCAAIHPLAAGSPFFRTVPLAEHGVEWVYAPLELAHPLDDGTAVTVERSVGRTAARLGEDRAAYERLVGETARSWEGLGPALLGPVLRVPRRPVALARFGLAALLPADVLARRAFRTERSRALLAGAAGHSLLTLDRLASSSFGLVLLAVAHAVGWPMPRGGSQRVVDAMASYLRSLGGEIETGAPVESLDGLPPARAVLCDVTPRQLLDIAGDRLPARYRRQLEQFRYGPGVFKLDWALSGPIPWAAPECVQAATVHVGGSFEEIAEAERAPYEGRVAKRPFLILAQQSMFDPTRAPKGQHTAWAYCHVPFGWEGDATEAIEAQVERFAPGFRERILARSVLDPARLEADNPNLVGGHVNGGLQDLPQLVFRPVPRLSPYSTPVPGLFICSASTPPGGGVHGMCGYWAARAALRAALS